MSDKTFSSELAKVSKSALEYIRKVLKERGTNYEIIDPATYDDEIDDVVSGLPRGIHITGGGAHREYPIVVINIDAEDKLTFVGLGGYDETKADMDFGEEYLSEMCICEIADIVAGLEN
jgi:hypothetical protein